MIGIEVIRWSFWSPESSDPTAWLEYWQRPGAMPGAGDPVVERIPPMQRRRMSRLAKMALSVALEIAGDEEVDFSIFCSRHGEIVRTRDILTSISEHTEISPTAFAQSVHNTSSGLYTIIAGSNQPSTSIAAGRNSFSQAWLEAQAYLADCPQHQVLLVDFDEVIPEEYRRYTREIECDHALALLLAAAQDGGIAMTPEAGRDEQFLPQGPRFLAWLQNGQPALSLGADGQGWRWER